VRLKASQATEIRLGRQRAPQHEEGEHLVPYLRSANITNGTLDLMDVKSMNFTPTEQAIFGLRDGDVLVTEGSGSRTAVGASAVWRQDGDDVVCFQNTLLRMRPRDGVTDPRYVAWWARHAHASGQMAAVATGANILHLGSDGLKRLEMDVPSLDEQRRIADFLDTQIDRISFALAGRELQARAVREAQRSEMASLVLRSDRHQGSAPLRRFARLHDHHRIPLSAETRTERQGGYPYFGASGVIDHIDDYLFEQPMVLVAEDGANLLRRSTPIAFVARGMYWVNNHAHVVEPLDRCVDYWAACIESLDVSPLVSGSAQPKLTGDALLGLAVPKPPNLPIRQSIERTLRRSAAVAETRMEQLHRSKSRLTEYKEALITAAVTGKLDVSTASGRGMPGADA
jgi:type I restriction enzyme S subunit